MAPSPGDPVDAKRLDPRPIQALPTIGQRHPDRTEDHVPAAVLRYLLFQDSLRPVRQKLGVGLGHRMLAVRPRPLLLPCPTAPTSHPPPRIDREHFHPPKRDEVEAPGLLSNVTRPAPPAAGARAKLLVLRVLVSR
jgi:hypothetical protein